MSWMSELLNDALKKGRAPTAALMQKLDDPSTSEQQCSEMTDMRNFYQELVSCRTAKQTVSVLEKLDLMPPETRRNIVDLLEAIQISIFNGSSQSDERNKQRLAQERNTEARIPQESVKIYTDLHREGSQSQTLVLSYIVKEKAQAVHSYIPALLKEKAKLLPEERGLWSGDMLAQFRAAATILQQKRPSGPHTKGSSPRL